MSDQILEAYWRSWVITCCGWRKIPPPTITEWETLCSVWYCDKSPDASVRELIKLRGSS